MIKFVCFKWDQPGYRSRFTAHHVNVLRNMLARNCSYVHDFTCVTDNIAGLLSPMRVLRIWDDCKDMHNVSWRGGPSCYRRLKMFSPEFLQQIAAEPNDFIISIDLDVVVIGSIDAMLRDVSSELFMWGTGEPHIPVCGSLIGFPADHDLRHIWDNFNGVADAREAAQTMPGSDQAVIAHAVGIENVKTWTQAHGVYSFGHDLCYGQGLSMVKGRIKVKPPQNASIVVFNGKPDPWECSHLSWVKEHYR